MIIGYVRPLKIVVDREREQQKAHPIKKTSNILPHLYCFSRNKINEAFTREIYYSAFRPVWLPLFSMRDLSHSETKAKNK